MAATAYASLVSLLNTMDQIQIHPHLSTCFDNYQFQYLREIVDVLVDFVENYSEAEDLMRRIVDAAHEAEDVIEVEAADRIRGKFTTKSAKMLLRRLEKMIQEMSSIKESVIKFKEETGFISSMRRPSPPPSSSSSSAPCAAKKTTMRGFDRHVAQLLDELIGHDSRRILPIVGMGGIGKTTLARNVYDNSLVVYHFDVRAWVTVSQEYNASDMLSQALSCLGGSSDKADDELGEELHQTLYGRRYLIVLDDVWSVAAWEKIKSFFPENGNGSRIVVTTREQKVVNYFGSSSLFVDFLDYKNSWDLFCEVAFAEQNCPPQLERIVEKIVGKCRGLPLAIRVIGGLLGKSLRTQEYWEEIAKDKSLVLECSNHKIDVSRLIKLWVAGGFIKRTKNQSLEQVAESYINELVDRNLLLVGELTKHKKVELGWSFHLHNIVRLSKLESLSIRGRRERYVGDLFESLTLPDSLIELTLDGCYTAWSGMAMIAYLPRLQLLHLKGQAMVGSEWKFVKEEFRGLKHLTISDSYDLINWIADKSNFPVLETLYLLSLKKLDEIPLDIGEIPTLEKITIINCSESSRMSAIKILEEQENLGNRALRVEIDRRNQIRGCYESSNLHFI
ncbi:putative late blight resistance protein R1B-16 [Salvia divinorum]|uniref:Late blight resistance protein R1B-16 n=1 Tax=Salvia divinorum TaxID=28513 RepID=A0ABD1G1J5_SALDI